MSANYIHDLILIASQNAFAAYLIVFVAIFVIGDISSLAGVWLAVNGALDIFILVPMFIVASLIGDFFYYSIGNILYDTKIGLWIEKHLPHHQEIVSTLEKRHGRLISFSKFIPFGSPPIFFMAGWIKTDIKKVLKYDLISLAMWQPILIIAGYFLAATFNFLKAQVFFRRIEILIALAVIIFFIVDVAVSRVVEKKIIEK
ncbi:MAG: VTT domain-containing protein [Patescibacteria group bacterium]|nr:VTT domain-containing protein [Patescibacteria group bacterium]